MMVSDMKEQAMDGLKQVISCRMRKAPVLWEPLMTIDNHSSFIEEQYYYCHFQYIRNFQLLLRRLENTQ